MKYIYLTLTIIFEVTGTNFMNQSEGFSKWLPTIIFISCFVVCFFFLSLALKEIPLGIAYAIWAGAGLVFTALISVYIFKQKLDVAAIVGIAFIVVGVVILNIFFKSSKALTYI